MRTSEIADLLVEAAAEVVLPRFRSLGAGEVMEKRADGVRVLGEDEALTKAPGDLVTVADQETELYITERLLAAFPDSVVLGEEAAAEDPTLHGRFVGAAHGWAMDPIDGTKNFVKGSPNFAVMLAETRDGVVSRSWVWQPVHERMYISERGKGATCNGAPIVSVPQPGPPRGVAGYHWVGLDIGGRAQPVTVQAMCCGVDYTLLAEGGQDFIMYRSQFEWDRLPGLGIITELGCVLRTYEGDDYGPGVRGSYLIAARTGELWDELRPGMPVYSPVEK